MFLSFQAHSQTKISEADLGFLIDYLASDSPTSNQREIFMALTDYREKLDALPWSLPGSLYTKIRAEFIVTRLGPFPSSSLIDVQSISRDMMQLCNLYIN